MKQVLVFDPDVPLNEQVEQLDSDLLQVVFPDGGVLAIGWYPMHDPNGRFIVEINHAKDCWDPSESIECRSLGELQYAVSRIVSAQKIKTQSSNPSGE